MKIISSNECNDAIKGYFKSLIDKGQQDVDVVNASAELIDVINEIPPAGVLIDMPSENDTFFEDFNNAYRKADVPEMQKQMISIAEDEERFNAVYKESVKMVMLMINEIEQYQAIGTIEECRAAVEKQVAKKPKYKKLKYGKHKWKRNESGEIDNWAWEFAYCNGVVCEVCGDSYCVHCDPDYDENEDCEVEYYNCPLCGEEVGFRHTHCKCGQKLDWEGGAV